MKPVNILPKMSDMNMKFDLSKVIENPLSLFRDNQIADEPEDPDDIDDDGEYQAITSFDISPVKFTAYVEHQTTPGWTNRLQLLAVGDRDRAFDDGVDDIPVDGYLVVDYISSIQLGLGTLEIGIENLFNNQYSTITSQYVGSFDDSSNFAARGRTLSFGYRVTW